MAYLETVQIKDPSGTQISPAQEESLTLLRRIFQALKPLGVITGGGSNRLNVDVNAVGSITNAITVGNVTGGTLPTVTTVTTVNQLGGVTTFELLKAMSRSAYNSGVRSNLS